MSDRLRVVRRRFRYPIGDSAVRVRLAGGLSRMAPEARAALTFREVGPGDDCSDMPTESALVYLERGDIEAVKGQDDGEIRVQ